MLRSIPPAGHPISLTQGFFSTFKGGARSDISFIESNGQPIMSTSSGTAAIAMALLSLKKLSPGKKVIIPAYTCPQVAAAVVKAGLILELCDLEANTFKMDLDQLSSWVSNETLAIIGVHLFGIRERISDIKGMVENKDVFLIEDSAQMSPWCNSRNLESGTSNLSSDMVIYSFGRGKPFSLLVGGALIVNNPRLVDPIKDTYQSIPEPTFRSSFLFRVKLFLYSIFFHPRLYWVPEKLPWLRLGETIFTLDFMIEKMPSAVKALGNALVSKCREIVEKRMELTEAYVEHLGEFKEEFSFFPDSVGNDIILHRFPIIFRRSEMRDKVLYELRKRGLGVTGMYPVPLNEQEGVASYLKGGGEFPNAKFISERILTLPLHSYVKESDIEKIVSVIKSVVSCKQ